MISSIGVAACPLPCFLGRLFVVRARPFSSFVCRCCGADEFIKLHAYTLTDYHRVVHLDADTLFLHPMDELMGESIVVAVRGVVCFRRLLCATSPNRSKR